MDPVFTIVGIVVILLGIGVMLGLVQRTAFSIRWLLIAAALVLLNDAALTNFYGQLPNMFDGSDWNWQGKLLATVLTLAVAAHPKFGWANVGLTLAQNAHGRRLTYGVAAAVCVAFVGLAVTSANDAFDAETLAFQLSMPGLDEEPFYRGTLLLALNEAFRRQWQVLGISLGWGGILSCLLFGLGHAFGFSDGAFSLDWMTMAATAIPAFLLIWFRERTGSLVLPVVLHNFANSISHLT